MLTQKLEFTTGHAIEMLALDRNEYFWPLPFKVAESISKGTDFSRYATAIEIDSFKQVLSQFHCTDPNHVTLGHGAEDLLIKIFSLFNHIIVHDFSWGNYQKIADGLGKQFSTINLSADLKNMRLPDGCLAVVTSPNNPTGQCYTSEWCANMAAKFPDVTFLIDAVYDCYPSPLAQLPHEHKNILFLGSMSKFFGMPGLRVGFAVGNLPRGFNLALGLSPYALQVASVALQCHSEFSSNRMQMLEFANNVTLPPECKMFPCHTQFFLMQCPNFGAFQLQQAAKLAMVHPKHFCHNNVYYMRWSLGTPAVNSRIQLFLQALS